MATNGLFPAFVRFNYDTAYFSGHTMTRSIREITSAGLGDLGTAETWAGTPDNVSDMIDDLVAVWKNILPDTHQINYADVYTVPTVGAPPVFLGSKSIAVAGTITPGAGTRGAAVQHSLQFRTTGGHYFKFISLDRNSDDTYGVSTALGTEEAALRNYIIGNTHAWCGQDDGRPSFFRNLSITLNDRLMRAYGKNFG